MKKLKSKDLLLLLLYVPGPLGQYGEPIRGRTLLQKMVFLFEEEVYPRFKGDLPMSKEDLPQFEAYKYGPFSKSLFDDIDFLRTLGFIQASPNGEVTAEDSTEYEKWEEEADLESEPDALQLDDDDQEEFRITGIGGRFVRERLLAVLSENQLTALSVLKSNCISSGLQKVLNYVYTRYPGFAAVSEIRDRVLKHGR